MPKMTKKLKIKTWTDRQIKQLPEPGYYLHIWEGNYASISAYCIMNGHCKYMHIDKKLNEPQEWWTLLWSCAPTKKKVANPYEGSRFEYFKTHEEMMQSHPNLIQISIKSPNDI
jgi:hypothetical protein